MKVCILGNGLTSLSLAKCLVNLGISIVIFPTKKNLDQEKSRTIGISKKNLDFFNKKILNINKFLWNINRIQIYSDNLINEKILDFQNKNHSLFATFKNYRIYQYLLSTLKKNKFCVIRKNNEYKKLNIKDYNLIINCDGKNKISKKFFFKKIKKKYNSFAHTTIIKHEKINNDIAYQIFTKKGPLAFLPLSKTETSIVYSITGNQNIDLKKLVEKYNHKYSKIRFGYSTSFELRSTSLRYYYYKNILAFGDLLHKLHPLAGQGFNMSLRDIKDLHELIKFRLDHGLELDSSICLDFETKTKHKNFLFFSGIDFIYEFFNFERKINNPILSKSLKIIGNNNFLNKSFEKIANQGLNI
jgi:2-octaprenyl-6-methoxyphenol hydroxylase